MDKNKKDMKDMKKTVRQTLTKRINIKNLNKMSLKIFFANTLGMIALIIFTHLTVAYSQGRFEIPFYDRTQGGNIIEIETRPPEEFSVAHYQPARDTSNVRQVINPDDLIETEPASEIPDGGENQNGVGGEASNNNTNNNNNNNNNSNNNGAADTLPAFAFEIFSDEMRQQGFGVSDGVYEPFDREAADARINAYHAEISRIMLEGEVDPELPPPPLIYEYRFAAAEPEYEIPPTRNTTVPNTQTSRRTVEPFMDYLIIRSGEYEILCTADGRVITRDFEALNLQIIRMRDAQNRTVFQSRTDESYFAYDPDDGVRGSFAGISFNPVFGNRGVPFMYPSYYGADGASNMRRSRSDGGRRLWGYADATTGRQIVNHRYNRAFNFSENIGITYQLEPGRGNRLFFYNETGQNLLRWDQNYYAPDIDDVNASHLGYYYFDNGLTRAYSSVLDRSTFEIVTREVILQHRTDARGFSYFAEFYIPEDYNVRAYSNGMILLEKDGYFGFMNHLGEWVAQPIYRFAQPFFEGVAVIGLENGKRALIDTRGNLLTRFRYDFISNCTGGIVALFERNEGWTILNKVRRQIEIEANS
jgi:hypothetical protein